MIRTIHILISTLAISCSLLVGCSDDFLDEKPSTNIIVPSTLDDFQRLLDNYSIINATPTLGEASADDYFILDEAAWNFRAVQYRNAYIWAPDLYEGQEYILDWDVPYQQVFVANVVLDGLEKMENTEKGSSEWNRIRGWALFVRGHAFYNLAQLFALPYDNQTSSTDLGIPIRLQPGVDDIVGRSTLQETYDQIIADLTEASNLLPSSIPLANRNRPSKPASLGLLARIYLNMRNYDLALTFAESALSLYDRLIDYNTVGTSLFTFDNDETIYQAPLGFSYGYFDAYDFESKISKELIALYDENDLRKSVYYRIDTDTSYRNSYSGQIDAFGGIATDELYLIKAEGLCRASRVEEAANVINKLLTHRYRSGTYKPILQNKSETLLNLILQERRKELIYRGLRWQDLRRLNKEGMGITIERTINNNRYILEANSPLYALPIPPNEIRLNKMEQNIR